MQDTLESALEDVTNILFRSLRYTLIRKFDIVSGLTTKYNCHERVVFIGNFVQDEFPVAQNMWRVRRANEAV